MSRYIDAKELMRLLQNYRPFVESGRFNELQIQANQLVDCIEYEIEEAPSIDIVRCKECKHRPIKEDANKKDYGFNVIAPNEDERCPCLVEDGWYSWIPKDDFYCGYGEREGE